MGGAQALGLPPRAQARAALGGLRGDHAGHGGRSPGRRRRRHRARRLRPARHRGQDRGDQVLPRAQGAVSRRLPGDAVRGRRVRPRRLRHAGRQLHRVRPRDRVPGHRPASRAEERGGHGRHHAPRRLAREARGGHQGADGLRRRRGMGASPSPLRGQQRPAPAARGRRPRGQRHRRRTGAWSRSASSPVTPGSWPPSSTPSSSRGPRDRRRCSATSWAPPRACAPSATTSWRNRARRPRRAARPVRAPRGHPLALAGGAGDGRRRQGLRARPSASRPSRTPAPR